MALPTRADFVRIPYRTVTKADSTTKATYKGALAIEFNTNLAQAVADTLATTYLNIVKTFGEAYEVTVQGIYDQTFLDGGIPQFTLTDTRYATDSRTFRLVSWVSDRQENLTVLTIRG